VSCKLSFGLWQLTGYLKMVWRILCANGDCFDEKFDWPKMAPRLTASADKDSGAKSCERCNNGGTRGVRRSLNPRPRVQPAELQNSSAEQGIRRVRRLPKTAGF